MSLGPKQSREVKGTATSADQVSPAQSFSTNLDHQETHCLGDVCIMVRVRSEPVFVPDTENVGSKISYDASLEEYARKSDAMQQSNDCDRHEFSDLEDDGEYNQNLDEEKAKRTDEQCHQCPEFAVDDCAYFMDPVSFAKELVKNVVEVSETKAEIKSPCLTEAVKELKNDQNSLEFMSFRDLDSSDEFMFIETKKPQVRWPTIETFTAELGVDKILEYLGYFDADEDWTFIVYYLGLDHTSCSDLYKYQAIYSLPTWKYPIAQATASIYFTIEVCRSKPPHCSVDVTFQYETCRQIHKPGVSDFKEKWLHYILDSKIKFFQTVTY